MGFQLVPAWDSELAENQEKTSVLQTLGYKKCHKKCYKMELNGVPHLRCRIGSWLKESEGKNTNIENRNKTKYTSDVESAYLRRRVRCDRYCRTRGGFRGGWIGSGLTDIVRYKDPMRKRLSPKLQKY